MDEMIANEDGVRFQALAVVLAKQKWPELIASERHNDLGLDAYCPSQLASDGLGKGLACSLSATLGKIKSDAEKIKKNYNDVTTLIFATPVKVTNQTAKSWAQEITKEFSYRFIVLTREEILSSLSLPANAPICRTHLGLSVPIPLTEADRLKAVQDASQRVISKWLAHRRLNSRPLIQLSLARLDDQGREKFGTYSMADIHSDLAQGRRVIIEGPAGRGKTTLLIQLAKQRADEGGLAFLVDLPDWLKSQRTILEYIAQAPDYQAHKIDSSTLAHFYEIEHFTFLLNGWNEVIERYSSDAVGALRALERDFPAAGIVVASRTHHVAPPLPGATRARLLRISRKQRADYLTGTLTTGANELRTQIDRNPLLDELTRTPLFLSEVATLFASGTTIPDTKTGVLGEVMRLIERSPEHHDQLQSAPMQGQASQFLAALATDMTHRADVRIAEDSARALCASTSARLKEEGQIQTPPEPALILNALCAHHVLERLEYPSVAFRFEHQQFQEFYAAQNARAELWYLSAHREGERRKAFASQYLNRPVWEESVRMVAEQIAILAIDPGTAADARRAGTHLIEMALPIDPVMAADLARVCGARVWGNVSGAVGAGLRAWYAVNDHRHRDCALAGMVASGSEDFQDIVFPLLTSPDQQVRLHAYRVWHEFPLSILGASWRQVVGTWDEDQRIDFIGEVMRHRPIQEFAEHFALFDPSPDVRAETILSLSWFGDHDIFGRLLAAVDDTAFERVLPRLRVVDIPVGLRPRAIAAYRKTLGLGSDTLARLRMLLAVAEWGDDVVAEIKGELAGFKPRTLEYDAELTIQSCLKHVGAADSEWVREWVVTHVLEGSVWREDWFDSASNLPANQRAELLHRIGHDRLDPRTESGIQKLLVRQADVTMASEIAVRLREIRRAIAAAPGQRHEAEWAIVHQLEQLYKALPADLAARGLLAAFGDVVTNIEATIVLTLYGFAGAQNTDVRSRLEDATRNDLRNFLKRARSIVLDVSDYSGTLKMNYGIALGQLGNPEDIADIEELIHADILRRKDGVAAILRGERGDQANGARMVISTWLVQALEWTSPQAAEAILLRLLHEPEYENDAARALVRLARKHHDDASYGFRNPDYATIWKARSGQPNSEFHEGQRPRYAAAINDRIDQLLRERQQSAKPDQFNGRLKQLAISLALLDAHNSSPRVLNLMTLPGQWDEWARADAIQILAFAGAPMPAGATLDVLGAVADRMIERGVHVDQNAYLLRRTLCLMAFVQEPADGITRIAEIASKAKLPPYEWRDILPALGHSRCDGALDIMLQYVTPPANPSSIAEWVEAVASLGTDRARRVLLSFIDPEIAEFKIRIKFDYHAISRLTSAIADIAHSDPAVLERVRTLCSLPLPASQRGLLASVIAAVGRSDVLLAGLNLIRDASKPPIPGDLPRGIEDVLLEKRPVDTSAHTYTLEPRHAEEIRRVLFQMVVDDSSRRTSAFALLGQIELWRIEHGRPGTEPRHPAIETGHPWPPLAALGPVT